MWSFVCRFLTSRHVASLGRTWQGWNSRLVLASSPVPGKAGPDPKRCRLPLNLTLVICSIPVVPCPSLIVFLVCLPFPRLLGLPAGLTLTTLPSDRAAWIRLPAGLATCRWSTRRWGSTLSSLKTRSLSWGRNTETLSDFEESSQVGEGKREGTGSSCSLFPVQICSAAEPDCAKYPNNLRWTEW